MNCTGVSNISPLAVKTDFSYLDAHDAEVEDISLPSRTLKTCAGLLWRGIKSVTSPPARQDNRLAHLVVQSGGKGAFVGCASVYAVVHALEIQGYGFTEEEKAELERQMNGCDITW